jgi:cold-inducible RNA-binding protein
MNIFVGNLACTVTDQGLRQLFELYSTVDSTTVMTDLETGHPCGFGFVDMPERSAARAAIAELHGTDLAGRALTVNEANWWARDGEPSCSRREVAYCPSPRPSLTSPPIARTKARWSRLALAR